jgi:hypothetical protein
MSDPATPHVHRRSRPLRPGQLEWTWATIVAIAWGLVIAGLVALGVAGRHLGVSPWWLGPETDPQPLPVWVAPFVLPGGALLMAVLNLRRALVVSFAASISCGLVALGDVADSPGVALGEALLGLAALLVTVAATAGIVRRVASADGGSLTADLAT